MSAAAAAAAAVNSYILAIIWHGWKRLLGVRGHSEVTVELFVPPAPLVGGSYYGDLPSFGNRCWTLVVAFPEP